MKKIIALVLSMMFLLSVLSGCVPAETDGPGENKFNLTTVREGYLTVATSPDYAPFEFMYPDENGDMVYGGIDVSVAKYIAEYTGKELKAGFTVTLPIRSGRIYFYERKR